MPTLVQISIAIIAVAFAVLVFFLIRTLGSAKESLDNVSQTLKDVQKTIDELTYEVKTTVRQANEITTDVQQKIEKIDPIMDSVKNLGEVLSELTLTVKQVSVTVIEKFRKTREHKEKAASVSIENAPMTPAEERTVKSYDAVYNQQDKGKLGKILNMVDMGTSLWQTLRR